MTFQSKMTSTCAAGALAVMMTAGVSAQVGKSQGVADVNIAAEKDLAALPNMNASIAKALVAKRPFASPTELNAFLLSQGLTAEQAMAPDAPWPTRSAE